MKIPLSGVRYLPGIIGDKVSRGPQTLQIQANAHGYLPELGGKALLLKIPCASVSSWSWSGKHLAHCKLLCRKLGGDGGRRITEGLFWLWTFMPQYKFASQEALTTSVGHDCYRGNQVISGWIWGLLHSTEFMPGLVDMEKLMTGEVVESLLPVLLDGHVLKLRSEYVCP